MVNPPWEPYPERKKRLEERARRQKNKQKRGREPNKHDKKTATNSITSTSSGDTDLLPTGRDEDIDSITCDHHDHGDGQSSTQHSTGHVRVRPGDCWCLKEGGCGEEDGCCMEDLPGVTECPCQQRFNIAIVFEVSHGVAVAWPLASVTFAPWLARRIANGMMPVESPHTTTPAPQFVCLWSSHFLPGVICRSSI